MSLSQVATCDEFIRYAPVRGMPGQTTFTQTATIQTRMTLWRAAADRLEQFLVERFEQNAELGKLGVQRRPSASLGSTASAGVMTFDARVAPPSSATPCFSLGFYLRFSLPSKSVLPPSDRPSLHGRFTLHSLYLDR
jgi:hypothetical protein